MSSKKKVPVTITTPGGKEETFLCEIPAGYEIVGLQLPPEVRVVAGLATSSGDPVGARFEVLKEHVGKPLIFGLVLKKERTVLGTGLTEKEIEWLKELQKLPPTEFVGYEKTTCKAKVLAIYKKY